MAAAARRILLAVTCVGALLSPCASIDHLSLQTRPRAVLAANVLESAFLPRLRHASQSAVVSPRLGREHLLCTVFGPGTLVSSLHAFNKALMCWCTDPKVRDMVVKVPAHPTTAPPRPRPRPPPHAAAHAPPGPPQVADVGFLGLLGSLALTVRPRPSAALPRRNPSCAPRSTRPRPAARAPGRRRRAAAAAASRRRRSRPPALSRACSRLSYRRASRTSRSRWPSTASPSPHSAGSNRTLAPRATSRARPRPAHRVFSRPPPRAPSGAARSGSARTSGLTMSSPSSPSSSCCRWRARRRRLCSALCALLFVLCSLCSALCALLLVLRSLCCAVCVDHDHNPSPNPNPTPHQRAAVAG
jgi:hypothetical protein